MVALRLPCRAQGAEARRTSFTTERSRCWGATDCQTSPVSTKDILSAPCPAGSWGKELQAWMCAGMKQLAPGADPDIELGRAYDLAMDLFKGRKG